MDVFENKELDKYVDDIAGIEPEAEEANAANNSDNNNNSGNEFVEEPIEESIDPTTQVDENGQPLQQENKTQQPTKDQSQQQQQAGQDTKKKQVRPLGDGSFVNKYGDITDENGKVIARKGFAARMYQENGRLRTQLEDRTNQLNEISRAVGEVKSLATSISNAGLDNNDMALAIDIASRVKRGDAVGAAKEVLAIIAAQGYNVTDLLGAEVGDSVELRAIKRMMDERFAPIDREVQARQQQEAAAQEGLRQYQNFVAQNEFADVHGNEIAAIMQRENVSAQIAYNRLSRWIYNNGLDISQPIRPQLDARFNAQTQQRQQQNTQQARQKPMPNGSAVTKRPVTAQAANYANADDDWSSIIKSVQETIGQSF